MLCDLDLQVALCDLDLQVRVRGRSDLASPEGRVRPPALPAPKAGPTHKQVKKRRNPHAMVSRKKQQKNLR